MAQPLNAEDAAYERALLEIWEDPAMTALVEDSFLDRDLGQAWERYRLSEAHERVLGELERMEVHPPARVLDFGGGRGLSAAGLARAGYRVTMLEPNPSEWAGLGAARTLRELAGLDFELAGTPIEAAGADSFDATHCRAVLHHLDDLESAFRALAAVLRPGGAMVASDEPVVSGRRELERLERTHPFVRYGVTETAYRASEYLGALSRAGFVDIRVRYPIPFGRYRARALASRPGLARLGPLSAPIVVASYTRARALHRWRSPTGRSYVITARKPA